MNPRYKTGVILFGVVLPLLAVIIVGGLMQSQKKRIDKEYAERARIYKQQKNTEMQTRAIAAQLQSYQKRDRQWDQVLEDSNVGTVTGILKEVSDNFAGSKTFKQDNFAFVNKETGIGAASKQPSLSFTLAFSGTFSALQESLLTLESRMPNLSLNSLELSPQSNGPLLEAKLSYSAWTKSS